MADTIISRARTALNTFGRDRRGNLSSAVAMALMPMAAASGVAIDYSRLSSARAALQAALDAGTLASATESNGRTEAELRATVDKFIIGNKRENAYKNLTYTVSATDDWT
ncbi:MAG: pilus assembly protein TadG-related protein, partial [Beijerinckiaceae bacterium]